jgi:hypothetical protein
MDGKMKMHQEGRKKLEGQLKSIETSLANAQEYLSKGINIESTSAFHLSDWKGKSGHPEWMRNVMIPKLLKQRARIERMLESMSTKTKDKKLTKVKRREKMTPGLGD